MAFGVTQTHGNLDFLTDSSQVNVGADINGTRLEFPNDGIMRKILAIQFSAGPVATQNASGIAQVLLAAKMTFNRATAAYYNTPFFPIYQILISGSIKLAGGIYLYEAGPVVGPTDELELQIPEFDSNGSPTADYLFELMCRRVGVRTPA